ncbi:MAG: hypothetical protein EB127_25365 [Alphaproteobacteria bacterium]|nr:hypothetical protein [Alphaproteobacteria bacterium]
MDTLYPGLFISYGTPLYGKALDGTPLDGTPFENELFSSYTELYLYGSTVLGIVILMVIACRAEPRRFYRTLKRRNTDESPLIQA